MNDNAQLVRLPPEAELDAQQIPHEVSPLFEGTENFRVLDAQQIPSLPKVATEQSGQVSTVDTSIGADGKEYPRQHDSQSKTDYTEREYLLKMYYEEHHMKRCEIFLYILAVLAVMAAIITPLAAMYCLPPAGHGDVSITVTSNRVSSITTSGGSYTVIVTSGDGVSVSTITTGGDTTRQKTNKHRKPRKSKKSKRRYKRYH